MCSWIISLSISWAWPCTNSKEESGFSKAYSKAIKFTTDELAYIDDRAYVTRKARDNISGTVKHALESIDYFGAPKKYLNLYKIK